MNEKLKKVFRYSLIYGLRRSLIKVLGRMRATIPAVLIIAPHKFLYKKKDIAVVGCGQFTFATIGYFITAEFGERFKYCFDVNEHNLNTFSTIYRVPNSSLIVGNILPNIEGVKLVYIASNHASHTEYAIQAIKRGVDVYIEKPISVTSEQLSDLETAASNSSANLYFGYNRPFSSAISILKSKIKDRPFTLTCSVIGHLLQPEHWYRDKNEGTRVCGNLGHWIDLAIHLMMIRSDKLFSFININITYSDKENSDDNLCVAMSTNFGDLVSLVLSAREEPFEGINESIFFQQDGLFVKIDDFRRIEVQEGSNKKLQKFRFKDVGHKRAILQPFLNESRNVPEVFLSTRIMLHIMDMVKVSKSHSVYKVV